MMSGNSLTKTLYIKKEGPPAPALATQVNKAQAVAQAQAQVGVLQHSAYSLEVISLPVAVFSLVPWFLLS